MVGKPHWRLWRILRNDSGKKTLRESNPGQLGKGVSKRIKGDKDARGKRRGSDEN